MASSNPSKIAVGKIKGYLDEVRQGSARPKSSTHFESGHGARFDSLQRAIAKFEAKPVVPSAKAVPAVASSGAKEVHELAYEVTRSGKAGSLAGQREGNPSRLPTKPTAPLKGSAREADTRDVKPERTVKFEGDPTKVTKGAENM